ncbi:MAG: DUF1292 domain-containing protein [Lachnospiraceae bacterium]|nr:DUF1292 domain-containing protein [Lachnospiraceae bacterium]
MPMSENYNAEEGNDTITITLEDDTELVCDVITVFPCRDKNYIALLPQNAGEEGEVYLYEFVDKGNDDIDLINIEDDEEFEAVSDAFDEWLDSAEFDDMFGDEEDE